MKTVRPCYVTVTQRWFSPCYEVLGFLEYIVLFMAGSCCYKCNLHIMPEFTPNDLMLQKHADKGEEDWEIFAECVRDVMCKQSGLQKGENQLREKVTYEEMLNGETKAIEIQGETYTLGGQGKKNSKEFVDEKNIKEPLI